MRAVIQRVSRAEVRVGGEVVGAIGEGVCVLVGVSRDSAPRDAEYVTRKLLNTRLWPDKDGREWREGVAAGRREVLLVSQFTLYARLKGNKPDFSHAMAPDAARVAFDAFVEQVRAAYEPDLVKTGSFGAMMEVDMVNDGPVTVTLDSAEHFKKANN